MIGHLQGSFGRWFGLSQKQLLGVGEQSHCLEGLFSFGQRGDKTTPTRLVLGMSTNSKAIGVVQLFLEAIDGG